MRSMPRLEQAAERLNAAIERLERALDARASQGDGEAEALRSALAESQEQAVGLKEATASVSARLDAAIDRLKGVLE